MPLGGHTNLGNGCRSKVLIINVRLDFGDGRIRDVFLVVLEESLKELLRVLEQTLPWLPVVVNLLSRL